MFEKLLPYYNQELSYVRESALEFAKAYPKIAKHLSVSAGKIEDPDVARLMEAFAFLSANVRYKLEDDFPEIAESLLSILYPHYLAPIPAFSVVQLQYQPELAYGYFIPKDCLVDTGSFYEEACTFKTVYPVTLWPIEVKEAKMQSLPFKAPFLPEVKEFKAAISLTLQYAALTMNFSETPPIALSFFLNGSVSNVTQIYKLLFHNTIGLAAMAPGSTEAVFLDKSHLRPMGFSLEDNLLPFSSHTAQGYDLLSEYFLFPEKFLFFELTGLNLKNLQGIGNSLEIIIYLNESHLELEQNLRASHFKLGCTPIVNLFPKTAEPFSLTHTVSEYPLIPDARRVGANLDIYAIQSVKVLTEQGEELICQPFYGIKHAFYSQETSYFWHARRRAGAENSSTLTLSFTHLDFSSLQKTVEGVVQVETLCSNGNLPSQLSFSHSEPYLQLNVKGAPVLAVRCLLPFTPNLQPLLKEGVRWKLLSHLSVNYLAFASEENGITILKEILRLYNFNEASENQKMIDSLLNIRCQRITARNSNRHGEAICQGVEIFIEVDDSTNIAGEQFLFFQILNQFFARYASINSFTRLVVASPKKGVLYQWVPRVGHKTLF